MPLVDNKKMSESIIWEPKSLDVRDPKVANKFKTSPFMLAYRGLTPDRNAFLVSNVGGDPVYADMLLMEGYGVQNLAPSLSNAVVKDAGNFINSLEEVTNVSFKAYSFRVSTEQQQARWIRQRDRIESELKMTNDQRQIFQLKRKIALIDEELVKQRRTANNLWAREYLMVPYANSINELLNLLQYLRTNAKMGTAPFKFRSMTRDEKEARLFRINNPAAQLNK